MTWEPYEGSERQRRRQRKVRIVAIVMATALLLPIVFATIDAVTS